MVDNKEEKRIKIVYNRGKMIRIALKNVLNSVESILVATGYFWYLESICEI